MTHRADQSFETVEAVAQVLYRQHRDRTTTLTGPRDYRDVFGEWERAGSHQDKFRADAREVLGTVARTTTVVAVTTVVQPATEVPSKKVKALARRLRTRAASLRTSKGVGRDAGQDEYEWRKDADLIDSIATDVEALLSTTPAATPATTPADA